MSLETSLSPAVAMSRPSTYRFAKRALDIVVASSTLVLLSPVFASIALVIKLNDGGPIFFRQVRVGRHGRQFTFYKFRSMVPNADALKASLSEANEAEGPIFKMKDDPRITRVGRILRKSSLDEFPQFFNVLRGDMSLVGPRPHLPHEIEGCADYPTERLSVMPGLVCLREVSGRSRLTFEEWIATDLDYVRRCSLKLDLSILMRAAIAVIRADGAY
jgi:lipopolysaccharide/colanic/teichoic acid biosynthesis glycosyltransferase